MKKLAYCFLILGFVASLAGCSAGGCYENHSAIPLAQFYSAETETAISINNLNIGGVGAPNDSLLLSSGSAAKEVYLPFRFNSEELSFYIEYTGEEHVVTGEDRVTFKYTAIPFFAGEDCGALYNYKLTDVQHTSNVLKRVEVLDSLITNTDKAYLRFYFHTESEEPTDPEEPTAL